MKSLFYHLVLVGLFVSCHQTEVSTSSTKEPESKQVNTTLPGLSIYNLPSTWTTQNNQQIQLKEMRGKVVVMTMIYTSCKTACPRLLADMLNIESKIDPENLDKMKFVIVSIDPETDTPERLKEVSKMYKMEDEHWVFLRGTPEDTREFAMTLAVNYKKISPVNFAHSNIISVFDEDGVLVEQREGLGMDYDQLIGAINTELKN